MTPSVNVWNTNPELADKLVEMHGHFSFAQIARTLGHGLSRNACIGKAKRLGLPTYQVHQPKAERQARQPREPKPPSMPAPTEPMPDVLRIPMLSLEYSHCRWPLWDHAETGVPDFPHCGLPKSIGSYCTHHAHTAFGPANVRAFHRAKAEASKLADIARNERKLGAVA